VETTIPALHDVIGIIYWMLLALVLFTTLRWLRARSGDRRARNDRRRIDRRDEED
jgi:DMSO/TMAO reductase YedYZ heme-binding membrane subunit